MGNKNTANQKITVASVLSFEKKLVCSDGYLYGTQWSERHNKNKNQALKLNEKSVRGTISNRLKPAIQKDPQKLNAEVEKPNLQTVDACALGQDQDTLKLSFTLKVLGNLQQPSACNQQDFLQSYRNMVSQYQEQQSFKELARRYASNLANARFLWRNRVGVERLEVVVTLVEKDDKGHQSSSKTWTFNPKDFSLRDFSSTSPDLEALAEVIEQALAGQRAYLLLKVEAYALVGEGQEVYPSEELVLDKGKGKKSKILYHVDGIAAMHSQKIGNALRTIDTWYPEYEGEQGVGPIAIEPYGSVTNLGRAFRNPTEKNDFFTLFDRFALGHPLEREEDEHYVMAVLIRGGVFGLSSKE